jgi:hypothetical protein
VVVVVAAWMGWRIFTSGLGFEPMVPILTEQEWDRLAQCESSGRWFVDTGNGYYGGLQIDPETWREYGGQAYTSRPNLASRDLQILIAERILEGQGLDAWPVCSYLVGLR